jgi:hypothetical protein
MAEAVIVLGVFHFVITLTFMVAAFADHGIYEHNIVRSLLNGLRGFVWPVVLVSYLSRNWPAIHARLVKDWREVFPAKTITTPTPVQVSELGNSEPRYMPGTWREGSKPE